LNIVLLYIYQLPVEYSGIFKWLADFIGLYKISAKSDWSEICSGLSLIVFYIILSWIRCDLMEMDFIMSARASSLTRQLLPSKHSLFIRESRSGVRHTNILLRGPILLTFGINYFTYGFSEPKGWSEPLDFLTCSFLLEFPLCESLCIWTSCVCSLYSVCLSLNVSLASIEWLASHFNCSMYLNVSLASIELAQVTIELIAVSILTCYLRLVAFCNLLKGIFFYCNVMPVA
ncbi:hypothetical protein ES332_A10G238500v1, partial [Gossypium tomentosum]